MLELTLKCCFLYELIFDLIFGLSFVCLGELGPQRWGDKLTLKSDAECARIYMKLGIDT